MADTPASGAGVFRDVQVQILLGAPCGRSSMVERWIVAPLMTVQLRSITPFFAVVYPLPSKQKKG